MMNELPPSPWIHIGECPVCVNGLCRVRTCEDEQGLQHLYAMCDECEAIWVKPDTSSERVFPRGEDPQCPLCSRPLYGEQAHWSAPEEVAASSDWSIAAIFEMPNALDLPQVSDLLVVDDIAADLDAPEAHREASEFDAAAANVSAGEATLSEDTPGIKFADSSYGQDEPKPGC